METALYIGSLQLQFSCLWNWPFPFKELLRSAKSGGICDFNERHVNKLFQCKIIIILPFLPYRILEDFFMLSIQKVTLLLCTMNDQKPHFTKVCHTAETNY